MLEIQNLQRIFANGNHAFRPLDLRIDQGSIVGILGTSGCGKSSLLRVLVGLDPASGGTITLDGEEVKGLHPRINVVFQEPRLLPWRTVLDNVAFGLPLDAKKAILSRDQREATLGEVRKSLARVGLEKFERHYPKECSGGMAQRVALARALVRTPEVLLLDEPFSALDAFIRMQLQDTLLEIHGETKATLVLVTHDIDEALYLCDRIIVLRGQPGRLVRDIPIPQVRPRHRGDPALGLIKEEILSLLDLGKNQQADLEYNI